MQSITQGFLSSHSFLGIPRNLVHAGLELTLRNRESLAFQAHLLWDCHSPACLPCLGSSSWLAGFAAALGWTVVLTELVLGDQEQPASGQKAPDPCCADLTQEVSTCREDVHLGLQMMVVDSQSARNAWLGPFSPSGCASGKGSVTLLYLFWISQVYVPKNPVADRQHPEL